MTPGPDAPPPPSPERPAFDAGYGIAAEPEGMLPWEFVAEQMAAASNYWICTTRPDGRPHVRPVWGVWTADRFAFGTGSRSIKARNLEAGSPLTVHLESGDDCVILEGTGERLGKPDAELFGAIADAYAAKYGEQYRPSWPPGAAWYTLRLHLAYAWRERDYPRSATRWRFVRPSPDSS